MMTGQRWQTAFAAVSQVRRAGPPAGWRVPVTFIAVLAALAIAGGISARIGASNVARAVIRVLLGGAAGLALTYGIGHLVGAAIG